ncbi:SpaA isopeptide-forming pilin-related protein, partial [Zhihengliuella salsuginis]|uniref:SpaA isopeptide-forming pilin-related protein n=1 Tax=Zhihengliuella salsuginis TaxID=578222 RepID=UPI001E5AC871
MGLAAGLMFSGSVAMATTDPDPLAASEEAAPTTESNETSAPSETTAADETAAEAKKTVPAEKSPASEPAAEQPAAEEPAPEPAPKQEPAPEPAPKQEPAPEPAPKQEPAPEPAPKQEPAPEPAPKKEPVEESEAEALAAEESEAAEEPEILAIEPFASPSEFQLDWPSDIDMATDPIGNADPTIYDQGSKENDPSSWDYSASASSPGSGDVGDTWVAADFDDGGDAWLWLAFERVTANGQIGYFLELNQQPSTVNANGADIPVRTVGDIRLIFPANNDVFSTPEIQTWDGSGWVTSSLPAGSWDHAVSQDGTLVEFQFNLSAIFGGADGMLDCGDFDFANIMLRSAASASHQSELKDFVGGSIDIDLCAGLTIEKTDESGTPLGGATFEIDPNPLPGGTGTLTITDNDANDDNPAAGTIELAEVNPGSYTVTEVGAPDGYLLPADRDQGPQTVEAGGDVTFTFEDPLAWEPLTVEKTIEASYLVDYTWDIEKSVDQTRIEQAGTTADFTYLVSVTEGERTASDFVASGMIAVENPNPSALVATAEDVLGDGTVCVIDAPDVGAADGHQISFAPGETALAYECEIGAEPETDSGSNTVTLTWSRADYPQEQSDVDDPENAGEASASDAVDFTWSTTETNETITVEDSQFVFDPAWTITWGSAADGVYENSYTITREVAAGECQTFENTATIVETGQSDDAEATLCVGADLVVEKNVIHSFDRTYLWDIEKTALGDQPFEADPETGDVTVEYEVTVQPDTAAAAPGYQDSAWAMSGEITVANPNSWQDVEATVSDAVDIGGGAECTVMDATQTIGAGESLTFDYTCTFTSEPAYDGENVATAVWDAEAASTPSGEAAGTAEVAADEWSVTPINETVVVEDDHFTFDPAWEVTWSEGMEPQTRTYELTWNVGEAGTCEAFPNVASVMSDAGAVLDEDEEEVQACREAPLVVSKSADGSFDRTYFW